MIAAAHKPVFGDAAYFIALLYRADAHHQQASTLSHHYRRLVTTQWVLAEVLAFFADTPLRAPAANLAEYLDTSPEVVLLPADDASFRTGLTLYRARPDKAWSLVDCISFEVMRERGLTDALTADQHFEQAGYKALLRG